MKIENLKQLGTNRILSVYNISQEGAVAVDIPYGFLIQNLDLLESGSYEVTISVNPISTSIPGFHMLFILLGTVALIAIIIKKKIFIEFHK